MLTWILLGPETFSDKIFLFTIQHKGDLKVYIFLSKKFMCEFLTKHGEYSFSVAFFLLFFNRIFPTLKVEGYSEEKTYLKALRMYLYK